jgi:hypothetical protein
VSEADFKGMLLSLNEEFESLSTKARLLEAVISQDVDAILRA